MFSTIIVVLQFTRQWQAAAVFAAVLAFFAGGWAGTNARMRGGRACVDTPLLWQAYLGGWGRAPMGVCARVRAWVGHWHVPWAPLALPGLRASLLPAASKSINQQPSAQTNQPSAHTHHPTGLEAFLNFCAGCWFFGHMIRLHLIPDSIYIIHINTLPETKCAGLRSTCVRASVCGVGDPGALSGVASPAS